MEDEENVKKVISLRTRKKKGCIILVGHQASGRILLTDLVGVESRKTVTEALLYTKRKLGIVPKIVVHDLSPNMFPTVIDVFGDNKSAIDPFHVMQDLNQAIKKDLSRFQNRRFGKGLKELRNLRNSFSHIKKTKIIQIFL